MNDWPERASQNSNLKVESNYSIIDISDGKSAATPLRVYENLDLHAR